MRQPAKNEAAVFLYIIRSKTDRSNNPIWTNDNNCWMIVILLHLVRCMRKTITIKYSIIVTILHGWAWVDHQYFLLTIWEGVLYGMLDAGDTFRFRRARKQYNGVPNGAEKIK
jgi:hypothetical protein